MTTNHSARVHPVHWCAFPRVIVKPFRKRKSVLFVIILKEGMYTACLGKLFQSWATHTLNRESESESCSVLSNSLQPHGLYSPWNSPGQNTGVGTFPSPGDLPNQGIEPGSPTLQVDSFPAWSTREAPYSCNYSYSFMTVSESNHDVSHFKLNSASNIRHPC